MFVRCDEAITSTMSKNQLNENICEGPAARSDISVGNIYICWGNAVRVVEQISEGDMNDSITGWSTEVIDAIIPGQTFFSNFSYPFLLNKYKYLNLIRFRLFRPTAYHRGYGWHHREQSQKQTVDGRSFRFTSSERICCQLSWEQGNRKREALLLRTFAVHQKDADQTDKIDLTF